MNKAFVCALATGLALLCGVTRAADDVPDFERDILPIFTRAGCNAGACHGKARGQNGFALSLLAFDPQFDYETLAKEGRGRRVFLPAPEDSLLLRKPIAAVPHGGGKRLAADGPEYATLLRWIRAGMPREVSGTPKLAKVTVDPVEKILSPNERLPLKITAHYSDGSTRDVTRMSQFQSNETGIAAVDESGVITATTITGEAAVMARYMGIVAVSTVSVPFPAEVSPGDFAVLPRYNFIDDHVWTKLQRLRLTPSIPATDHAFLRRAYIDIIGRVPTADEARAYLTSSSPLPPGEGSGVRARGTERDPTRSATPPHPDPLPEGEGDPVRKRRAALVDQLLAQPDYADHWANKWADLLRPNPYRVGIKAVFNFDGWIRDSFRKNQPYDQFVRELLTARGSTFRDGNVVLFRDRREPDELTTIVSQLFLGVRLECAKCHHHPFENFSQDDFYSFAAFFSKISRKGTGISAPISGSEELVFTGGKGSVKHPLTGVELEPRPLFGKAKTVTPDDDPREVLAAWVTSPDNTFFAETMANRVWTDFMERGLVEPVDDLRASNPASNGPLLAELGRDFRDHAFDIKHLIRRITTSYAYGLGSLPNDRNAVDGRNYSRHYRQRLRAEVLLDSASQITGTAENFSAMPAGSQAKEIWTHRIDSLFLDAFGRPDPNQDPPFERTTSPTVVQTLHLMNSENLFRKVTSDTGRAAQLAASEKPPKEIVDDLYLSIYARFPTAAEAKFGASVFEKEGTSRRQATEDLMWALLNTAEFVFKD